MSEIAPSFSVNVKNTFIDFGATLRSHKGGNAARRQFSEPPPFTKTDTPIVTNPANSQQNCESLCEDVKNTEVSSEKSVDLSCETEASSSDEMPNQVSARSAETNHDEFEVTTEKIESSSCKAVVEMHSDSEVIYTPRSAGEPEWEPDAHTLHLQSSVETWPAPEPAAYEQITWSFVPFACANTMPAMFKPVYPSMELAAAALAAANEPPPEAPPMPSRHKGGAKNMPWKHTRQHRESRTPNNSSKASKGKGRGIQVRFCSWCGGAFQQHFKFCQFCGVSSTLLKS